MSEIMVYVACTQANKIDVFALNTSLKKLVLKQELITKARPQPLFLAPQHNILYAGMRDENALAALLIDRQSGLLQEKKSIAAPFVPTYISTNTSANTSTNAVLKPTQNFLFWASYNAGALAVFSLEADGLPQELMQIIPNLPRAHCAVGDQSGKWLVVPTLGNDALNVFAVTQNKNEILQQAAEKNFQANEGAGCRHGIFAANNRFFWCVNELDGTVNAFSFDEKKGQLGLIQTISALPKNLEGAPWCAEIALSLNQRFLYVSERRSHTIAQFLVNAGGKLALIKHYPTQIQPRGMVLDQQGEWLFCAGQVSNALSAYQIAADCGDLTEVFTHQTGQDPIGMACLNLKNTQ